MGVMVKPFKSRPGGFLESFSNFLADPTGLTQREIVEELEEQGIDVNRLKDRVKQIIKKGLEQNRYMERHLITNGETIEITKSCPYIVHECCKCGIRHKWEFVWKKKGLEIKITLEK